MPVLSVHDLTIQFSGPPVLENVQLHIDRGERVCIVGRNGAGKSTLLKTILGEYAPNSGTIAFPEGGLAAALPQVSPENWDVSVHQAIALGFGKEGEMLINEKIDGLDPDRQWVIEEKIDSIIELFQLSAEARFTSLSGGQKRRVLMAKAIVAEPALLILDEPTNHMDIESIVWLESYLKKSGISLLFVTHDRTFLKSVATRIVEIDLAQLISYRCNYDTYLVRKAENLEAEEKNRELFAKKLSQEEAWLRKGIRARRTRNEGRVKALKAMRTQSKEMRQRQGTANFELQQAGASGQKAITALDVSFKVDEKTILQPFDLKINRNDRIGIIGPNGSGKSTLIKILLEKLSPTTGTVEQGTKLDFCYFDQMREQLDESLNVFDNIANGNENVSINGRQLHVISYLKDFLFTPDRSRSSIKTLSGGERNRLLIAKLFTQPFNFLVMDEPTNDLDAETLEMLEELLVNYKGTLLLVSHDREFLNNTVTSIVAINKNGYIEENIGGYDDWLAKEEARKAKGQGSATSKSSKNDWKKKPKKFLNKDRQELEAIPGKIDQLETQKEELIETLADPTTYTETPEKAKTAKEQLEEIDSLLETTYERWQELEALKESLES
ncbi:ATP-binding cassette domain-containing protein [Puniceicoccaceae bacterium K14]|nr:ATP-binding cassette domain-containing protein [Puniceicoccaceae bacterium K14]